jgi:hypothetical protein
MYLRCLAGDRPRTWIKWLPWAEFCYNSSFQTAIGLTPFQVVYGRPPPALLQFEPGSARVAAVDAQLRDRDEFLAEIRERLLLAQEVMKQQHDKKHRDLVFAVGDWVWLRLHHRTAVGITPARATKLGPRYFGPYLVLARVGSVAYRLQLPANARIHDVFHVALLKPFVGTPPSSAEPVPLPSMVHGRVVPVPLSVLRARLYRGVWDLLVQWEGQSAADADASWTALEDFKKIHPSFQLEDELFQGEGGNVVDSYYFKKTYSRRRGK